MSTSSFGADSKVEGKHGTSDIRQLVVFRLRESSYALDIQVVREINRMIDMTAIPKAPDFVKGIINLRGEIVPVVDIGLRFGIGATEQTKDTRIVVVESEGHTLGLVVDEVSEVLRLSEEEIDPATNVALTGINVDFVIGVGKVGERLILILAPEKLFSAEEREQLKEIAAD